MKLAEQRNHVKTSEGLQTTQFKLQMSAKMAQILSDGIYSDKIKAVIRELSTNAKDSHTAAGKKDEPIRITLPTNWASNFIVEDFGVGLSPEQIDTIYTMYGASDKENSNDAIGCLGLGSKTPFCYNTKTAAIESVYNGIKYSYSAYIGENSMPVLSKLGETPTNQPNGVKISIPVNRNDVHNFINKAKEIYEFFDPKPEIKGYPISFDTPSILVSGQGWELRSAGYHAMAIMGSIAYPIDFSDTILTNDDKKMMGHPFYINFDIGDLNIEVSREGLSYDVKTKSAILAKFRQIRGELAANFNKELQKCKTLWDARLFVVNKSGVMYDYVNRSKLEWQGKVLFPTTHNSIELPSKIGFYSRYNYSKSSCKLKDSYCVDCSENVLFLRNDLDKGLDTRIFHRFTTVGRCSIYVVNDDKQQQELIDTLGLDPSLIVLASTLPRPAPKVRISTGTGVKRGNTHSIMEFQSGYDSSTMSNYYTNVQKDFDDGGYYVEFNTFKIDYNGTLVHPRNLNLIINTINKLSKRKDTVYAIKSAKIPKLAKAAKPWTEYISFSLKELDTIYSNLQYTNLEKAESTIQYFGRYSYVINDYLMDGTSLEELSKLVTKQDFQDLYKLYLEVKTLSESNIVRTSIETLYNTLGRAIPVLTATPIDVEPKCIKLMDDYKQLNMNYPLLSQIRNLNGSSLYNDVAIYMNAK